MAQISIVKYSDIIKETRFDAEYFKPEYLKINEVFRKIKFINLGKLTSLFSKGIFNINAEAYVQKGVPFIRILNLKNIIIDTSNLVYINEEENNNNKKTELTFGDLVLSKTAYPACSFITMKKCNVSQDIIAIKLKKNSVISSKFVAVFLNTRYGLLQMQRNFTGNIQMHLNLTASKEIMIPVLANQFRENISQLFDQSFQKQSQSKQLYKEAEELLLNELGLLNYKPKHKLTFETTKSKVDEAGRYDAEYFQPKYEEIIKKIENYKEGFDIVEEVLNIKDKNFTPKNDKRYKYIELSNIGDGGEIIGCTEDIGSNLPTRARRKVIENDVIISSIEGSLNSVALITKKYSDSLCSTGFYVVDSHKINPETLLVLTKSYALQSQLKRGCKGTILTAIPKDELNKIKIPLMSQSIQKRIANKIQESFKLRKESKELLEKAKRMVEEEIEKEAKK